MTRIAVVAAFLAVTIIAAARCDEGEKQVEPATDRQVTVLVCLSSKAKRDIHRRFPPALQTMVIAPGAELLGITRDTHDAILKVNAEQLWSLVNSELVTCIKKELPDSKAIQPVNQLEIEYKLPMDKDVTQIFERLGRIVDPPDRYGIFTLEPTLLDGDLFLALANDKRVLSVFPNTVIVQDIPVVSPDKE